MGTSLCAVTTGKGYRKKTLGTLSESEGLGEPPRRPVCVYFLAKIIYYCYCYYLFLHVTCSLAFCSFGSSVVEFGLAREDLEDTGDRRPTIQYLY